MKKNGVAENSVAHKYGLPLPCTLGKIRKIDEGLKSLRNNVFDHEIVCGCGRFGSLQRSAKRGIHNIRNKVITRGCLQREVIGCKATL